jgi:signal transduction histidine kinase
VSNQTAPAVVPSVHPRRRPLSGARRALASFGPALAVLVVGIATFDVIARFRDSRGWVEHTRQVLAAAQDARTALVDIETGQRGFLIAGEPAYLEPYHSGMRALRADTLHLRHLTSDNAAQQRRLDVLSPLIREHLALLDSSVAYRQAGHTLDALAIVRRGRSKILMDSARTILDAIDREEHGLLDVRLAAEERHARLVVLVVIGGTLAAVIFGLLANALLAGYAVRQADDATALEEQNEELLSQRETLQDQQMELESQAAELEAANEELLEVNESLEEQRTAAEAAREAALSASRAKSEFLSAMSHELRTPLNAIGGHVQLLEMGLHGPVTPEQRATLARVDRAQRHLLGLINDILNLARIERGKLEFDLRAIPLGDLIADVAPMIEPQLGGKGLTQEVRLADPSVRVLADPDRTRQIVLNLLANAVKFTDAGGRISVDSVDVAGTPPMVQLRVHDTGRGIPPDQLERIFDPFVQLDRFQARPGEGTGLGLAISRELARGMGGDLWADSEVGVGSTFNLMLRRADADAPATPPPAPYSHPSPEPRIDVTQ